MITRIKLKNMLTRMETLPLEILVQIASHNYYIWRGMLSVRSFAEYTLTRECRSYVLRVFGDAGKNKSVDTTLCGELHSYFDQYARINKKEDRFWYYRGLFHREGDLPAVEYLNGTRCWYRHGLRHRDRDLPALIDSDGLQKWYRDGLLHRGGDKPAIIYPDGTKRYYRDGHSCNE